jgi:hypothetical protein
MVYDTPKDYRLCPGEAILISAFFCHSVARGQQATLLVDALNPSLSPEFADFCAHIAGHTQSALNISRGEGFLRIPDGLIYPL